MDVSYLDISKMIDHSLLQPFLTDQELEAGCQLALKYNVASVCIKPYYLQRCAKLLAGSTVRASTTIGFPHGGHLTCIKQAEAEAALDDGGQELDMVVNIGKVKSGDWDFVQQDIKAVNDITVARGQLVKVIFENCFLNNDEKIKLCKICGELGVAFVKTSTGYGDHGATLEDLALMRKHSPLVVQVKAAGGVRDFDNLLQMRKIGVSRVGASRTKEILDECRQHLESRV